MKQHDEKIRRRAYAIWEQEGRPTDRDHVHWYRAETEIALEEGPGDAFAIETEGTTHALDTPLQKRARKSRRNQAEDGTPEL